MTGRRAERAHPQSVRRTSFTLHTSMAPLSDTDPPSKEAATVTRQPFILGSFRIALALGEGRPVLLMTVASPVTLMLVVVVSLPFPTVSPAAAPGSGAFIAAR